MTTERFCSLCHGHVRTGRRCGPSFWHYRCFVAMVNFYWERWQNAVTFRDEIDIEIVTQQLVDLGCEILVTQAEDKFTAYCEYAADNKPI